METVADIYSWKFVLALVAVINGLGVVRLLGSLGVYLRNRATLNIQHYWVYTLSVVFQVLLHLLFWWSILNMEYFTAFPADYPATEPLHQGLLEHAFVERIALPLLVEEYENPLVALIQDNLFRRHCNRH